LRHTAEIKDKSDEMAIKLCNFMESDECQVSNGHSLAKELSTELRRHPDLTYHLESKLISLYAEKINRLSSRSEIVQ
jgi:hypothetical protein